MPDRFYESAELLRLDLGNEPYLIPDILAREDKILCIAKEKVGKSILAQQLASCVAGGHPFLGHLPVTGEHRVLYLAGEGSLWTWQKRTRRMGYRLPVPENRLWFWQTSTARLNTPRGLANLLAKAAGVRPDLTVIDSVYTSIAGSMNNDDIAIAFVQAINAYQEQTGSAVLLTHHAHRPVKDADREEVNEGDQAYFGSFVWAAWPESMWLMRRDSPSGDKHSVMLSCKTVRDHDSPLERAPLMMAEPNSGAGPLLFVPRDSRFGPTTTTVLECLRWQAMTAEHLVVAAGRSRSAVSEALTVLRTAGAVVGDGGRPEAFEVVTCRI